MGFLNTLSRFLSKDPKLMVHSRKSNIESICPLGMAVDNRIALGVGNYVAVLVDYEVLEWSGTVDVDISIVPSWSYLPNVAVSSTLPSRSVPLVLVFQVRHLEY